ncbi:MAG: hypothetical protein K2M48_00790 [Clostridiales bacterium]|nr:hypothetical protein [Clostridiales bacterium]
MALHQTGELKKRAWLAKQRLKMGYWESVKTDADEVGEQSHAHALLMQDGGISAPDEKLYRKVCAILDRDELTINPIGQLIDGEVYAELDPAAKQRYVLELSDKFRELKERYYRERTGA